MIAELISAGANLLGGVLGQNKQDKIAKQNIQLQKDFAQHGIQWKVEDAKAAGLHPLAALGAQTSSFSPVSVGDSITPSLSAAGQDLSRAVNSTRTDQQRADAYTKTIQDLTLRKMGLENEMLASQIAKINQAGTPPAMSTPGSRYLVEGQGNTPLVTTNPVARLASDPNAPSMEAGGIPESGNARTAGGWAPVMSKDIMDRQEEDAIGNLQWNIRNRLMPYISEGYFKPPQVPLEQGQYWWFNPITGEYQIYDKPRPFMSNPAYQPGYTIRRH